MKVFNEQRCFKMMISKTAIQQVLKTYQDQGKGKQTAAKTTSPSSQPDQVILSAQAQDFGQLMQQVKATADVRQEKVAQLAQSIENGTYNVSGYDIAGKLLSANVAGKER